MKRVSMLLVVLLLLLPCVSSAALTSWYAVTGSSCGSHHTDTISTGNGKGYNITAVWPRTYSCPRGTCGVYDHFYIKLMSATCGGAPCLLHYKQGTTSAAQASWGDPVLNTSFHDFSGALGKYISLWFEPGNYPANFEWYIQNPNPDLDHPAC